MQITSRIPKLIEVSFDSALLWLRQSSATACDSTRKISDTIFNISDDKKVFSDTKVAELRSLVDEIKNGIGHGKMIKAYYPIFTNEMGIKSDA